MQQVQLTDQLFEAARRRATQAGFGSVDEYVADVVLDDVSDAEFDPVRFFTPERLAELDAADASIRAGRGYTTEQLDAELAKRRAEWLKANNA